METLPKHLVNYCLYEMIPFTGRTVNKNGLAKFEKRFTEFKNVSSSTMLEDSIGRVCVSNLEFCIQRYEQLFSEDVQDGFTEALMNIDEDDHESFLVVVQGFICARIKIDKNATVLGFLKELHNKVPTPLMSLEEIEDMISTGEHTILECVSQSFTLGDLLYYGY